MARMIQEGESWFITDSKVLTDEERDEQSKDEFVQRYGSMIADLHQHMMSMPYDQFILLGQALVACVGVATNARVKKMKEEDDKNVQ